MRIYVYIHIHTGRQIQRHTVLELDKYWWICGSEMENADFLMKCYDCKRGREQRLVPSPVAVQGNAVTTAFHGSQTWWIRFQSESEAIPYLTSFRSCVLSSICFCNAEISGLYQVSPSGKFRQSIGPKDFLAVRSDLFPMLKIYLCET